MRGLEAQSLADARGVRLSARIPNRETFSIDEFQSPLALESLHETAKCDGLQQTATVLLKCENDAATNNVSHRANCVSDSCYYVL